MILLQQRDKVTKEFLERTCDIKITKNKYTTFWKIPFGRESLLGDVIIPSEYRVVYEGNYFSYIGKLISKKKK